MILEADRPLYLSLAWHLIQFKILFIIFITKKGTILGIKGALSTLIGPKTTPKRSRQKKLLLLLNAI